MKKQILTSLYFVCGFAVGPGAAAAAGGLPDSPAGFYGGIALRDQGSEGAGVSFGTVESAWTKFTLPATEDAGARTLAYGGYRWANDIAFEAAVATTDRYALNPAAPGVRRGVGLALSRDDFGAPKAWNVDVYTSWAFRESFALYGRLGYAQNEPVPAYVPGLTADVRRGRDGVNYGVGLRYDMSKALGLRLEYARFGRLPGDAVNGLLPENDQVQFGVQFRF